MHVDCPPFGNRFFAMFWSIPICQNHKFAGTRLPNLPLRLGKTNACCLRRLRGWWGWSELSFGPQKIMAFLCGKSVKSPDGMRYLRTSEKPQIHPNSSKFTLAENLNTMKYYEITMKRGRSCGWRPAAHPSVENLLVGRDIPTFLLSAGFHHFWHWWLLTSKRYQCCGNGRYNQWITWRHHWIHSQEVWSYRVYIYIYIYV